MYEGSMIGAGSHVFAVWGYVIAKQIPSREVGSQVDLNPSLIAFLLGETENKVVEAIEYLCSPDRKTTTKTENGRRLIRLGEFAYQVVNGAKYRAIRDTDKRLESNREAQRRFRLKEMKKNGKPLPGEATYEKRKREGASEEELENIADNAFGPEYRVNGEA